MIKINFVLMCGGFGSRLWPLSSKSKPKQFLKLCEQNTILEDTILRNKGLGIQSLISNIRYEKLIQNALKAHHDIDVILEPCYRGTAVLSVIASLRAIANNSEIVVLSPSDLIIKDVDSYRANILDAAKLARENNKVILFSIKPKHPETNYGYIKIGKKIDSNLNLDVYSIDNFVEKPSFEIAKSYFESGGYFWNSGIFIFKPQVILDLFEKIDKRTKDFCYQSILHAKNQKHITRLKNYFYSQIQENSIDYAIIEKTKELATIHAKFDWSDVGNFSNLLRIQRKDSENFLEGKVLLKNVKNCYISSKNKIIVANNINNIAIIDKGKYLLVSNIDESQSLKELVSSIDD